MNTKHHPAALVFACAMVAVQAHAQQPALSVSDLRVTRGGRGISTITGTATNVAGRPLTDAFLTFNLYDQAGAIIGNTMAHVQNLGAGERWQFAARTPLAFARVEVSQVQVFPSAAARR